ncbi:C3HC zinc finger-like-domain-containing protein [Glomus cerebriforme]|uniref:C3HC zinc finger-like-domain-containing protein n=1 Tax=Glomus cerebriforme TaxID=658196 RepID=A0A397T590_9GLOM|nr:C3HC zinc finger-like-domain-containing protein [Glomus cerebriforme]
MRRLATFSDSTWFAKPDLLSPVECSRYGWVNIDEDWLKCEYCGERILVKISPNIEIEKSLIEQYHEGLTSSHSATCPWRERHCDDYIYKVSLSPNPVILKEFQIRSLSLIQLGNKLPVIKTEITEEFIETIISVMPQESKTVERDILASAGCLSLFGWEYELIDGLDMLKCPFCFRQCALLTYRNIAKQKEIQQQQDKGDKENNNNEQNAEDTSNNHIDDDILASLDLTFDTELEHRWYCAWITGDGKSTINKTAEELTKKRPGWHITLEGIVRCSIPFDPKKKSDEQLADVRIKELRNTFSPRK